jgi:hypothetical protein
MTDFIKTIANGLNVFGGDPPTLWGSGVFGTDLWGYGSRDLIVSFYKLLSDSVTITDTVSPVMEFNRTFTASMVLTMDQVSLMRIDRAGYKYVFGVDENAENRPLTSYNDVSGHPTSYTTLTNTQTSWTTV